MSAVPVKFMGLAWSVISKIDAKRISKQTPPSGAKVIESLPYCDDNNAMHLLNVYRPENSKDEKLPTVIDIHGGWMYGDKDLNKYYCMYLASKGYAVMGMSYRLIPTTDLKGQVQDIFKSLHWLEKNADKYNFDLNNVLLTGDSAGGHFTGLVGSIAESPELQKLYGVTPPNFKFSMLALSHAACDASFSGFPKIMAKAMQQVMFGKSPTTSPLWGKAGFEETSRDIELPPVMLISSQADPFHKQTLAAEEYLKSRNADYSLKFWTKEQGKKLSHIFHIGHYEWPQSKETNDEMLALFDKIIEKNALQSSAAE